MRIMRVTPELQREAVALVSELGASGEATLSEQGHLALLDGSGITIAAKGEGIEGIGVMTVRNRRGTVETAVAVGDEAPSVEREIVDEMERLAGARGIDTVAFWPSVLRQPDDLSELGYSPSRTLLRMDRTLPSMTSLPEQTELTFGQLDFGVHREQWLEVNNAAFSWHPESAEWTTEDLVARFGQSWFDPEGVIGAWESARLLGFCWTKMHPGGVGEIYVIAVVPEAQGRGIGRLLTLRGLDYMHKRRGATRSMLYVEDSNRPAKKMYRGLGFGVTSRRVAYEKDL